MVDATALAGKHYELRDKYGETISDGRISKKPDEIMVNRGVGQRLFVRDTPEDEWEEVGASAGPKAVEAVCKCGNDTDSCLCAVPTEAPAFVLNGRPYNLVGMPTASTGDASAPPKQESGTGSWNTEAWKTPPAREPEVDKILREAAKKLDPAIDEWVKQNERVRLGLDRQPRLLHDQNILDEAKAAVYGPRQANYGHPKINFKRIADLWNGYMQAKYEMIDGVVPHLDPEEVAHMMVLVKMARLLETPNHRDSYVDIAGYAAAGARAVGIDE